MHVSCAHRYEYKNHLTTKSENRYGLCQIDRDVVQGYFIFCEHHSINQKQTNHWYSWAIKGDNVNDNITHDLEMTYNENGLGSRWQDPERKIERQVKELNRHQQDVTKDQCQDPRRMVEEQVKEMTKQQDIIVRHLQMETIRLEFLQKEQIKRIEKSVVNEINFGLEIADEIAFDATLDENLCLLEKGEQAFIDMIGIPYLTNQFLKVNRV